jgi:hypothetical protein
MRPLDKHLMGDRGDMERLGGGMYASAFLQSDGTVLKIATGTDATMDYIGWCYHRMQKYGKGSPEMWGLPEVEHFGKLNRGWFAVMPRYNPSQMHGMGRVGAWDMPAWLEEHAPRMADLVKRVNIAFSSQASWGPFCDDIHSNNIMFDTGRDCFVLTDPASSGASGTMPREDGEPARIPYGCEWIKMPEMRAPERVEVKRIREEPLPGCGCRACKDAAMGLRFDENMLRQQFDPGRRFIFKRPALEKFRPFSPKPNFAVFDDFGFGLIERKIMNMMKLPEALPVPKIKAEPVQPIGPGRQRNVADWKKPGLQRLHHMR